MGRTVSIKEEELQEAISRLKRLEDKLDKIELAEKEEGESGASYRTLKTVEKSINGVQSSLKGLIGSTIILLNNLQETLKTAEKNIENQIGGGN